MITTTRSNLIVSCNFEPFEDRIDILFKELEMAIRWHRPSILLAIYRSVYVRADAEEALKDELSVLGHSVRDVQVTDETDADIPLLLSEFAPSDRMVFFVDGLRWGGGADGMNAYRALNIHRDSFIDNRLRVVFWLTEKEARDLAHCAPDYWAFRHRVLDFTDTPKPEQISSRTFESTWQGIGEYAVALEDIEAQISLRETLLADLPDGDESTAIRANLLFSLGVLQWRIGDFEKATAILKTAHEIVTSIHDNWFEAVCLNALALVKSNLGRISESIEAIQQAIHLVPGQTFPLNNLGNLYCRLNLNDEALAVFQKAVDINPEDPVSWNGLGNVYYRIERLEDAVASYQKAIEINPGQGNSWNGLGDIYARSGKVEEAIHAYQKAAGLNGHIAHPWINLGHIHDKQGRSAEAIESYQKALEIEPRNAQVWNDLGNIHLSTGDYDTAIMAYKRAIALDHSFGCSFSNLALAFSSQGKYAEAIPLYLESIEILSSNKDKALAWNGLGNAYRRLNDYPNAIASYQKADELEADSATPRNEPIAPSDASPQHPDAAPAGDALPEADLTVPFQVESPVVDQIPSNNPGSESTAGEHPLDEVIAAPVLVPEGNPDEPSAASIQPVSVDVSLDAEQGEIYPAVELSDNVMSVSQTPAEEISIGVYQAAGEPASDPAFPQADLSAAQFDLPHSDCEIILQDAALEENTTNAPQTAAEAILDNLIHESSPVEASDALVQADETGILVQVFAEDDISGTKLEEPAQLHSPCGTNLSDLHSDLDHVEDVIATYKKVTEINPNNARAWDTLGNLYRTSSRYSDAISAFEQAIAINPEKEVYHYHLGLVYATQKRYDEAISAFQKVVELNPDYNLAHCALAGYYRKIGQGEEAEKHLTIALPNMREEKEYNRACFEAICGNTDQAIALLKDALDKKQTPLDWVRRDPDLDFIRDDPRFKELIGE